MCGVVGYMGSRAATAAVLSGLALLQHRGQDSAGFASMEGNRLFIEKGRGLARDVLASAEGLPGDAGIGHVRYSTRGSAMALSEIQPFYVNQPFGIALAHNGNLINEGELRERLAGDDRRHINSDSDSELLLNVLARAVSSRLAGGGRAPDMFLDSVADVHRLCAGAYAAVALIAGAGLLAFRDPRGIRPLSLGKSADGEWLAASESAAFSPLQFECIGDVKPGEAVFIDMNRNMYRKKFEADPRPCIFEHIYFARPDSLLDGALVYDARVNMGRYLASKIRRQHPDMNIDCVVPIPDSGRVAALEVSLHLNVPYREGLVKNRHTGRTFIVPGQSRRRRSVAEKLNIIAPEFKDKDVLLVDDSIVRGTTAAELVGLARAAGARRVYFASAAPPVRHPNVFGIDIATRGELVAHGRGEAEITTRLGADSVIYQDMSDLISAVRDAGGAFSDFETSCFDGEYPDERVNEAYLSDLESRRGGGRDDANLSQLDLALQSRL